MPRPKKAGLDYFSLDVDFLDDPKIKILKARYGRDGIVLYIYLLCEIYKQGYYLQVDDDFEYIISDDLKIDQNKAKQVLNFLLSRSLFDNKLFQSDKVLTSAGIQRRFQLAVKERARKNPIKVGRYWLLEKEDTEPFIKCTLFGGFSEINASNSGKNEDNSTKKYTKESKVYKKINIAFDCPELEEAFQSYLVVREYTYGEILPEQIQALRDDLRALSSDTKEQIAIVKKATAGGYKGFHELKRSRKSTDSQKKSKGNNFVGRDYNMDELERGLLGMSGGEKHEN